MNESTFPHITTKLHVPTTRSDLVDRPRLNQQLDRCLEHKFRSALTRQSHRLLCLETIQSTCNVRDRHYAGIQTVPVRQIRGSEGRCEDFDADFCPLRTHSKERWLRIAIAQQTGKVMPPVKLVWIGDVYFVRDGHHRISVARALGQKEIDAEVTV